MNDVDRKRLRAAPPPDTERLIRMKELITLVGLGRSTIYRLVAEGRFPPPIYPFNNRLAAWPYSQIAAWIADRCDGKAA